MPDPHDQQQLPRTPADLEGHEGAGVFSVAEPGTAEADDFDAEIADDLVAFDAEMIAKEGADAWTTDRAIRLAALQKTQAAERLRAVDGAEDEDDLVGYVLGVFRRQRGWSRDRLADWLGVDEATYGRLATTRRPAVVTRALEYDRGLVAAFAERFGAHPERLLEAVDRADP